VRNFFHLVIIPNLPNYSMVPVSGTWLPTLNAAGISVSADSYGGTNIGGMFALSAINPTNWTRSYSKSAYIDPQPPRNNLHIIFGATVEKMVFADNLVGGELLASGVDFSTGRGATLQNVVVNKEVILSGGAMGSPHILMVSGVGPKDVLDAANVSVKSELPGVGQHLMDHLVSFPFLHFRDSPLTIPSQRLLGWSMQPQSTHRARSMPLDPTYRYAFLIYS
jgi:choline dehydrogenase-like flavoprotein